MDQMLIGGVPLATERGSVKFDLAGATVSDETNNLGWPVGYLNAPRLSTVDASVYPYSQDDAAALAPLLALDGYLPVQLPRGQRIAARPADDGHRRRGWHAQGSDHYESTWVVDTATVLLADLCWRGATPGAFAYSRVSPVYQVLGLSRMTLLQDNGWQATGNDAWNATLIAEASTDDTDRTQVTLVAEVTVTAGATAAVGLGPVVGSRAARPLGGDGVGVQFTSPNIQLIGASDVIADGSTPSPFAGRYRIMVTARPGGGRVEVWRNQVQLLRHTRVLWQPGVQPPVGAIYSVRHGTAILHRWWLTRD